MISRRLVLGGGLAAGFGLSAPPAAKAAATFEIVHSDAEWRRLLTSQQYGVLRQNGTEAPFSSALLQEHRPGVFTCAGCARDLFSSTTKYDSHTGWPSFWAPLDKAVDTRRDTSFGMVRTAVECAGCGGHLGHVFNDGPQPTGLRYCMNGIALGFKAASA
ncbi:MAG TPA: peptide-methionine (R)-S-oxide reductase MsrB [Stellaceae bacterium]|jgi:peptide-methionine (R)-S-oxide reductase|nr:peptide-methionine (R)-S-oxide reductase MsrB [Stellaceae bacterium]